MTGAAVSINPATGERMATYPFLTQDELPDFLDQVAAGQTAWAAQSLADRCAAMSAAASILRGETDRIASIITTEMGKPIAQARAEVLKSANAIDWFVQTAPGVLAPEETTVGAGVEVHYRPLGVVLAVEPWNFPVWQIMRGSIGILLAGNGYLLKPAPTTVGCALALQEVFERAGVTPGAFSVLNADNDTVSAAIKHDAVVGVTVTGSVGAGSAIAAQAGREIKRSVLELGGADPFIVLADADVDAAVDAAVTARFQNSGQVCIAAKRIILEEPIREAFVERFVERVKALTVGDPFDESINVGPIAREDLRDQIADQVQRSVDGGATVLAGGVTPDRDGFFYSPTVLGDVAPGNLAFDQEIFGPVAVLVAARDADHAVALANDSEFGLSSSVWTADVERAREIAARLQVGSVFVNTMAISDPRVPIGGIKKSGYGRELSHFGLQEFTNVQTVWAEEVSA